MLIDNKSTSEIALLLNVSEKTVRNHIFNVMQKLGVKEKSMAILKLIRMEELSL